MMTRRGESFAGPASTPRFSTPPQDYQRLSASYTLTQQGYTANISCMTSSSPTITLDNSNSAEHTVVTPSLTFDYTLETWSWSTNCSGNGEYCRYLFRSGWYFPLISSLDTGEANLWTTNGGPVGNGLFATSVCFYQDFFGPSNHSFRE